MSLHSWCISALVKCVKPSSVMLFSLRSKYLSLHSWCISALGCVRLGNPDFDFGFRISDFPIKREIQKRISTNRNPFPRRISIKGP